MSSTSGWFVAASTMMPSRLEKPSISVRIWFKVCSCSLEPPIAICPRARPMASSSSMKMIAGACSRACLKRSRTRAAPTPTIISTNSARAHREERHPRLSRDRLREQGLPGARRADQQHAFRSGPAQARVLRGVLEEIHDLDQLVLGFVDAGDVVEGDLRILLLVVAARLALADAHEPAPMPPPCCAARRNIQT